MGLKLFEPKPAPPQMREYAAEVLNEILDEDNLRELIGLYAMNMQLSDYGRGRIDVVLRICRTIDRLKEIE